MGRLKLLRFGLGAPELFCSDAVSPRSSGSGFENSLRDIAARHGLAYLVSPQVGELWRTLVMLRPGYLQEGRWVGYSGLRSASFAAYLNPELLDQSEKQSLYWEQCVGYPGLQLQVMRAEAVKVRYQTEKKFE
jgi:peptide deformylase